LKNAIVPATTSPSDKSVVATGRRIKGVERDIEIRSKPLRISFYLATPP